MMIRVGNNYDDAKLYNPQWNNGIASTKIERSKEGISLQEKTNLETWKQFEYDCISSKKNWDRFPFHYRL